MHYHVMNGNPGCLPDNNEIVLYKDDAERIFLDIWQDFVWTEPENWKVIDYKSALKEVNADSGNVTVRNDGQYYIELSSCEDVSCEEEYEEEYAD